MILPILVLALLLPFPVFADSQCIALEGASLTNRCQACVEVTVHELRPPGEQASQVYSGVSRTVRLESRGHTTLQGGGSWMIGDLKECR